MATKGNENALAITGAAEALAQSLRDAEKKAADAQRGQVEAERALAVLKAAYDALPAQTLTFDHAMRIEQISSSGAETVLASGRLSLRVADIEATFSAAPDWSIVADDLASRMADRDIPGEVRTVFMRSGGMYLVAATQSEYESLCYAHAAAQKPVAK